MPKEFRNRILDSLCNWGKAPVLLLTFYVIIIMGLIFYIWSIYLLIRLANIYPTTSLLFGAALASHIAFMLVAFWLPMSNFLIWLMYKKPAIPLVYMVGCVVTIALCFTTLLLLEPYRDRDFVRNEYLNKTMISVKNTEKGLPSWAGHAKSMNCCSWYGPYDFGRIYQTSNTGEFIKALQKECFYANDAVVPDPGTHLTPVPGGCSKAIKKAVKESCEQLFITSVTVIFTTLACILVYLYYYWQMLLTSVEVADSENRRMVTIVAQSVSHIQSLMSLQSPSVLGLNALQRESQKIISSKNKKSRGSIKRKSDPREEADKLIYGTSGGPERPITPYSVSDISAIK